MICSLVSVGVNTFTTIVLLTLTMVHKEGGGPASECKSEKNAIKYSNSSGLPCQMLLKTLFIQDILSDILCC